MHVRHLASALSIAMAATGLFSAVACSTSSEADVPASCLSDPTSCPAGQTCWPVDLTPHFTCLSAASSAALGASCTNTLGAPTCGAGMACDQTAAAGGTCTLYCNPDKTCPTGYDCIETQAGTDGGVYISVCRASGASSMLGTDSSGDSGLAYFPDGGLIGIDEDAEAGTPVLQ